MTVSQGCGLVLLIRIRSRIFGAICSSRGTSDTPTAEQVISAVKTQIACGLSNGHMKEGKCEADDAKLLSDFRHLFTGLHQLLNPPGVDQRTKHLQMK